MSRCATCLHLFISFLVAHHYSNRSPPLAARVWDNYLLDGEVFIFRCALGYIRLRQDSLRYAGSFEEIILTLQNVPQDIDGDELFANIAEIDVRPDAFSRAIQWHEQCARKRAEVAGEASSAAGAAAGAGAGASAGGGAGGLSRDATDADADARRVSPFTRGAVQLGHYTVNLGAVGESISSWF